jgi:cobalt-zinc-cadmium efflux system outer membrane protein
MNCWVISLAAGIAALVPWPLAAQQPASGRRLVAKSGPIQRVRADEFPSGRPRANQAVFEAALEPPLVPEQAPLEGNGASGPLGLPALTGIAEGNHPVLMRARAEIEAAKGNRVQAGLYPNPRFETNNPEFWAGSTSQVNFGYQQDIVVKGKIRLEKAAADQDVRKTIANFELERMQMLTELRSQFYQTLAAKARLEVSQRFVEIAEKAKGAAEELERAGVGTSIDVLLLTTELERSRVSSKNALTALQGEYRQLAASAGVPTLVISDVNGVLFHGLPEFGEGELSAFIQRDSSYIRRGSAEITRNKMKLRREEVEPYPNIRTGPSYAISTDGSRGQFWLSVVFDIPVWDLNQGNIRAARAELQRSAANLDVVRTELFRRAADSHARYLKARHTTEQIRSTILPTARKAQSLVLEGYEKGQFDVNRLLQAQRAISDVYRDYIDAAEQAWTTAAELAGILQREQFP